MNLEPCERETVISFSDESETAQCYTLNRRIKNRLFKLCESSDEIFTHSKKDSETAIFYFPKSWVRIRPPRQASDAQREAARQNVEKARAKKDS